MKFRDLIASIREKSIEHEKDIIGNSEKEDKNEINTNNYNEVVEEKTETTIGKKQRRKK